MSKKVCILLGTKKGAFILESAFDRQSWRLRGPYCATWPMNHVIADPATGTIYAGGGNEWFGPAVWKSTDLGASWTHSSEGLAYGPGEQPIKAVWSLAATQRQPLCWRRAGRPVSSARTVAEPGRMSRGCASTLRGPSGTPGGGGLILHSLVLHPDDDNQIWVGISAAGVFHTADGGETWEARNRGTRADFLPEGQNYPEHGQCVHCLVMAPGMPNRLYQQNHCGMYRSDDGGRSWESIEAGLPSSFGFPAAAHPRDPDTLFLVPLNGDTAGRFVPDARAAVWRTRDGGKTWSDQRRGCRRRTPSSACCARLWPPTGWIRPGCISAPARGTLYASADEGDSWTCSPQHLPVDLLGRNARRSSA